MAVSYKMSIFNAVIFVILVQIVANSPKNQQSSENVEIHTNLPNQNYMVAIKIKENVFEKICDGYVVTPKVVLTAAHCLYNFQNSSFYEKSSLFVDYTLKNMTSVRSSPLLTRSIENFAYPEAFDIVTMKDDIALLFLTEEMKGVSPIAVNSNKIDKITEPYYVNGNKVIMTSVLSSDLCGKFYRPTAILDGMICIKDYEFSQSKAVFSDDQLVAIESWTNNVIDLKYPKMYTNVQHYSQWIQKEIGIRGERDYGVIGIICYSLFTIWVAKRSMRPKQEKLIMGI